VAVSPALERYAEKFLTNSLWKNAALSPRDRSVVTVAALIATNQSASMPDQLRLALENGVKPSELSEMVMHLALYTGLANANAAASEMRKVFEDRGIGSDQMAPVSPELLPLNAEAASRNRSDRHSRTSRITPPTSCSRTSGFGPRSRREIVAW
jgi:4-carboxymuconolactone decarboxylase